ncbi:MAG: putative aminoacrylate hydrolase RutD [Bacteroidetes bacterium ADurb.Bin302]|nr:MAG: putative aminoacrylate hydrolase RutD [Bacteroidetes bacterium ADurb.Bin302]
MKQFSYTKVINIGRRIMLVTLSICLVIFLILFGVLLVYSPGRVNPYLDKSGKILEGSISQKIHVSINGIEQGMFIKGKDLNNPVLLYLHGGMPDYFLTRKYPTGLEDYFTVVWWEQRGSGLSFSAKIPPETMTLEQMISDTKEVTNYLRNLFGKDKIYLMGHSGGTFVGIQVASRAPELYHAYIGVSQISNQLQSERLAYEYMLKNFAEKGNKKMVRKLEAAPVTLSSGTPYAYRALRDQAMHSLGIGTTHDMNSVITGIFIPSFLCREYTLTEKFNLWRGKSHSGISVLWSNMITTDLAMQVTELKLPVYFVGGIYDYTVSCILAKDYFGKVKAPVKGFYTFEKSAHSPMFEEPEKMQQIVREDILPGLNSMSDS